MIASLLASPDQIRTERARRHLLPFTTLTFPAYSPSWHHERIAAALEAVECGEIDRLIITVPPRHGKSELASVRFPAWYLGRNPDKRVIGTSYAAALAFQFSRQARNLVTHPRWPFPSVRLADDQAQIQSWSIAGHRGGYVAAGVGGPITGMGADLLIIDDPVKNEEEADSQLVRDGIWDWYTSTAYTRLEAGGAIVLIMTRWHADDLAGRLIQQMQAGGEAWRIVHLPALSDDGAALWPEKYDRGALDRIKTTVGSRVWTALYQGAPSNDETSLLKRGWWRYYRERPARFDEIIQSWDCAFKDLKSSDYVVGHVWGRIGANKYLLDRIKDRLDIVATLNAVRQMTARWPQAHAKLIEDKANGPAVIQLLHSEIDGLIPVNPEGGKIARVNAVSPQIEAGNVSLPDPSIAPWIGEFVEECAAFPNGAHDDEVDAMSQALLRWIPDENAAFWNALAARSDTCPACGRASLVRQTDGTWTCHGCGYRRLA